MPKFILPLLLLAALLVLPGCYTVVLTPDSSLMEDEYSDDYRDREFYSDDYYGGYYYFYATPWWGGVAVETKDKTPGRDSDPRLKSLRSNDGGRSSGGDSWRTGSPSRDTGANNNGKTSGDTGRKRDSGEKSRTNNDDNSNNNSNNNSNSSQNNNRRDNSNSENSNRNNDGGRSAAPKRK